jgi:hypothetical protein
VADVVFGIDRLQLFVFGEVDPGINLQDIVLDTDVDAVFLDASHFQDHRQRLLRLKDIDCRQERSRRDGRLLLLLNFALMLHLKLL